MAEVTHLYKDGELVGNYPTPVNAFMEGAGFDYGKARKAASLANSVKLKPYLTIYGFQLAFNGGVPEPPRKRGQKEAKAIPVTHPATASNAPKVGRPKKQVTVTIHTDVVSALNKDIDDLVAVIGEYQRELEEKRTALKVLQSYTKK